MFHSIRYLTPLALLHVGFLEAVHFHAPTNRTISDQDDLPTIAFVSHHKTGTMFGTHIERCLLEHNEVTHCGALGPSPTETKDVPFIVGHFNGYVPDGCKLVHMVRAPLDIVKSSYMYSKALPAPEAFLTEPMTSTRRKWLEHVPSPPADGESISTYLNRVSTESGILVEMLTTSARIVNEMEDAFAKCQSDDRVLTVDLATVFYDFEGTMSKIYRHLGLNEDVFSPDLKQCIREENPASDRRKVSSQLHGKKSNLSSDDSQELTRLILQYDADLPKYVLANDVPSPDYTIKTNMYTDDKTRSSPRSVEALEAIADMQDLWW